jgi:hypothetical protein
MSTKTQWSKKSSSKKRRQRALDRLEAQLKSGEKPTKFEVVAPRTYRTREVSNTPLEESDRKRIQKEIETLKSRI